jgi:hypothetical protein
MRTPVNVIQTAMRIAIVASCLGTLSACVSIPQRAWANGEAMTASRAYSAVQNGDNSIQAHRRLQSTLDPRRLNYREVAYPAFGNWWY